MKRFAALAIASFIFACTSSTNPAGTPDGLAKPDLAIEQINRTTYSGRSATGRSDMGGAPVNFRIVIRNNSAEPIKLRQIEVSSITQGAYTVQSTQRPYQVDIAPKEINAVEMWAPAYVENTIGGGQGPVTLRVIAHFESEFGKFREVYIRTVNDPLNPRTKQ